MSSCQALDEWEGGVLLRFMAGKFGSLLRLKYPRKNTKKTHLTKKKMKFVHGLAGVYTTREPNFSVYLQKTAWTLDA